MNLEMFSDKLTYSPEENYMILKKNNILFKNQYQIRADSIFNNINTNFSKAFFNVSIYDTTNKSSRQDSSPFLFSLLNIVQ